jgi:hypothetical protein
MRRQRTVVTATEASSSRGDEISVESLEAITQQSRIGPVKKLISG